MELTTHTAESIIPMVGNMPIIERIKLLEYLLAHTTPEAEMEGYLTDQRFADGRVCPICGGTHVRRNGRRKNGSQQFRCMDCGKSFSIRKNTIFSGTRKHLSVWKQYLDCMTQGLSLDKSAERCGISHATAFAWRHKILDALKEGSKDSELAGIVEADETFFPISYKGDAKPFANGEIDRAARTRGGEVHTRGLSDELVCVPCAIDRKGHAVSKIAKLGKCSTKAVKAVLGGHVEPESTLCTDEEASYRKFARDNNNPLVQIKGGQGSVKGIYHIQHLNAYHSNLKHFIKQFRGVSTKYLNNYLVWHNEIERKAVGLAEKVSSALEQVATTVFEETCRSLPLRDALPILVKKHS